jgi:hypothetical protein
MKKKPCGLAIKNRRVNLAVLGMQRYSKSFG